MSTLDIRPAGHPDLPRVRALAYAIWPEAYAGILPEDRIGPMLDDIYSLDALSADIDGLGHRYWIAARGTQDLGFASAYREAGRVWIKKLYVLASARGSGVGRGLMAEAATAFPGAAELALYVNNNNAPAIAFYRAQGFALEAEVPVRMGPFDFTDFVMVRPL